MQEDLQTALQGQIHQRHPGRRPEPDAGWTATSLLLGQHPTSPGDVRQRQRQYAEELDQQIRSSSSSRSSGCRPRPVVTTPDADAPTTSLPLGRHQESPVDARQRQRQYAEFLAQQMKERAERQQATRQAEEEFLMRHLAQASEPAATSPARSASSPPPPPANGPRRRGGGGEPVRDDEGAQRTTPQEARRLHGRELARQIEEKRARDAERAAREQQQEVADRQRVLRELGQINSNNGQQQQQQQEQQQPREVDSRAESVQRTPSVLPRSVSPAARGDAAGVVDWQETEESVLGPLQSLRESMTRNSAEFQHRIAKEHERITALSRTSQSPSIGKQRSLWLPVPDELASATSRFVPFTATSTGAAPAPPRPLSDADTLDQFLNEDRSRAEGVQPVVTTPRATTRSKWGQVVAPASMCEPGRRPLTPSEALLRHRPASRDGRPAPDNDDDALDLHLRSNPSYTIQ
ncbi:hypothetical protein PBRA_008511 [Plasmodiophora brassicae]|nr:hypothetical protein PBRA_008511 [Plasmodiophora brassicae]